MGLPWVNKRNQYKTQKGRPKEAQDPNSLCNYNTIDTSALSIIRRDERLGNTITGYIFVEGAISAHKRGGNVDNCNYMCIKACGYPTFTSGKHLRFLSTTLPNYHVGLLPSAERPSAPLLRVQVPHDGKALPATLTLPLLPMLCRWI